MTFPRIDTAPLDGWNISAAEAGSVVQLISKGVQNFAASMTDVDNAWAPIHGAYEEGPGKDEVDSAMVMPVGMTERLGVHALAIEGVLKKFSQEVGRAEQGALVARQHATTWNAAVDRGDEPELNGIPAGGIRYYYHDVQALVAGSRRTYDDAVQECARELRSSGVGGERFTKIHAALNDDPGVLEVLAGVEGSALTPTIGGLQKLTERAQKAAATNSWGRFVNSLPEDMRKFFADKHKFPIGGWKFPFELNRLTTGVSALIGWGDAYMDAVRRLRVEYPGASEHDIHAMANLEAQVKGTAKTVWSTLGGGFLKVGAKNMFTKGWFAREVLNDVGLGTLTNIINRESGASQRVAETAWKIADPKIFGVPITPGGQAKESIQKHLDAPFQAAPHPYKYPNYFPKPPDPPQPPPVAPPPLPNPYIVKEGDYLEKIQQQYEKEYGQPGHYLNIQNRDGNKITNPDLIYPGQELVITGAPLNPAPAGSTGYVYPRENPYTTVQPGDSMEAIAKRNNTTVEELIRLNKPVMQDPNKIYPNMKIYVPERPAPTGGRMTPQPR